METLAFVVDTREHALITELRAVMRALTASKKLPKDCPPLTLLVEQLDLGDVVFRGADSRP